jgi:outer membrane protein TolC
MSLLKSTLFSVLILIAANAFSQPKPTPGRHEFTAKQCVEYAEKNSAVVKNSLLDIKLQEQQNRGITAAAYPQVNASINTQYNPNVTVQTFPNFIAQGTYGVLEAEGVKNGNGEPITSPEDFGFIQAQFGTKWTASAGATLSQILFDGQVFVGLQARETSISYREQAAELTKEQIRTNIYKIYYQLSVANEQIRLIDANIARTDKLLSDSRELYKNGFAESLDVDRASVQLTNFQAQKQTTLNNVSNGYLGLKVLMGMPVKDTLILTDSVTAESIQEGALTDGAYKYEDRPDYRVLSLTGKLQEYNVRRYKLAKVPTASLNAGYSKLSQRNYFDFFTKAPWFSSSYIGLTVDVPIFSGFLKNANIKTAQLELEQTNNNIENLKLQIDQDVDSSINSFNSAITNLNNQKKNVDLASRVYDLTKKKYESGLASTTDISNAQADLTVAQTSYIVSLFNAVLAKIDYLKAIGKL